MSTRVRIDIKGLVGIDLGKYDLSGLKASHLVAIFLSPELVKHDPRLIVNKEHIDTSAGATTLPYTADGDNLVFDISNYNLDLQVTPTRTAGVSTPSGLAQDPDGSGVLGPIHFIPALAAIAGHATLDTPYVWPATGTTGVVAAFRVTTGEAQAHLPQNGPSMRWSFFDGAPKIEEASWKLQMNAADTVVCQVPRVTSALIVAEPRAAGDQKKIAFKMSSRIIMRLVHACQAGECDETTGKEFPRFYQMLEQRHRTPQAIGEPLTDTGWCPPGLFWS
jgi:hypothetical protein